MGRKNLDLPPVEPDIETSQFCVKLVKSFDQAQRALADMEVRKRRSDAVPLVIAEGGLLVMYVEDFLEFSEREVT